MCRNIFLYVLLSALGYDIKAISSLGFDFDGCLASYSISHWLSEEKTKDLLGMKGQ